MGYLSHEQFISTCPVGQFIFYDQYKSQTIAISGKCLRCGTISTKLPKTFQAGRCKGCANKNHPGGFFRCRKTNEQFLKEARLIHGDKYEYLEPYEQARVKIKIRCKKCDSVFHQLPQSHLDGYNCKQCMHNDRFLNASVFEAECSKIHNNQYEYFQDYKRATQKVKIKCKKCESIFYMKAANHKDSEQGCVTCGNYSSKGEKKIREWLKSNNINYIQHYKFSDCKHISTLIFDFYLPNLNLCIEYDGQQHFKPIKEWGGTQEYNRIKIRDNIKNDYCSNNSIVLIRIPYTEYKDIFSILETNITHNRV